MTAWHDRLHTGNCIEDLNRLDPAQQQADLIFADPPYNIGYSYDVYEDNLEDRAYLDWSRQWIEAAARVLKPSGAFWIAIGDEYAAEIKQVAEQAGLHLRSWVIWYYTFGVHCQHKFTRSHTHLLYFVKNEKGFTFNNDDIRVPSARQLVYADSRADSRGRLPDNTWILRPQDATGSFRPEDDTWYFARVAGTFKERAGFHGCQMPERLLERIVRACSNPGDVVLDPFAGSASTLVVAKKLGRRFVGYELSPEYVRFAEARLAATQVGDPIDGPADPLTSVPATQLGRQLGRGRSQVKLDERAIADAFQQASQGFSVDRLIADPVMNAAFQEACSQRGLPGRPRDWNQKLMAMRKTGKHPELQAEQRFELTWQAMDPFEFASEISLQRMLEMGHASFDDVLCDPAAAAQFDEFARALSPGFTSLEYRWAALRFRKDAHDWRRSAERMSEPDWTNFSTQRVGDVAGHLPLQSQPGVYVLSLDGQSGPPVYIGETWDLSARSQRIAAALQSLDRFLPHNGAWQIAAFELPESDHAARRGLQSWLIRRDQPRLNFRELAAG